MLYALLDFSSIMRVELAENVIQDALSVQVSEIVLFVNPISTFCLSMTQDTFPVSLSALLDFGSMTLCVRDALKTAKVAMDHHNGNAKPATQISTCSKVHVYTSALQ